MASTACAMSVTLVLLSLMAPLQALRLGLPVRFDAGPVPPVCSMHFTEADCKGGCVWCTPAFGPGMGQCVDQSTAQFYPPTGFTCTAHSAVRSVRRKANPIPGPFPPPLCDLKNETECVDPGCVWCTSIFGAGKCMTEAAAQFMPPMIYKCGDEVSANANPIPGPVPPPPVCDLKNQTECVGACVWCTSVFGPGKCVSMAAAQFLPPMIYKCDDEALLALLAEPEPKPKPRKPAPAPAPLPPCKDRNETECDGKCTWCTSLFGSGKCVTEAAAQFLPPVIYKCTASPAVADPEPAPGPVPPAPPICNGTTEAECVGDCVWCTLAFNASTGTCVTPDAAHFLPPFVFKCKKPKDAADLAEPNPAPTPAPPPPPCKDRNETECDAGCVWCTTIFDNTTGKCVNETVAPFLPPMIFKCGAEAALSDPNPTPAPTPTPPPPPPCKYRNVTECTDGCEWCTTVFDNTTGKCVNETVVPFLPPMIFKCGAEAALAGAALVDLNPNPTPAPTPTPPPPPPCKYRNVTECTDGCEWCTTIFDNTTGKCVNETVVPFLPPMIFKCGAEAARAALAGPNPEPVPPPPPPCKYRNETECVSGCVWCTSIFNATAGKCLNETVVPFLPPIFKCTASALPVLAADLNPLPPPPLPPPCKDRNETECDAGCVWCTTIFNATVGKCMNKTIIPILPPIFKCKTAATVLAADPDPLPPPSPPPCKDRNETECTDGCAWCTTIFNATAGKCMNETILPFMPPIFKCNTSATVLPALPDPLPPPPPPPCKDRNETECTDGCAWCTTIFNATAGKCMNETVLPFMPPIFKCNTSATVLASDPNPTPGPTPTPPPPPPCKYRNVTECTGGCEWCTTIFDNTTGKCVNETVVPFLPPMIFKCVAEAALAVLREPEPAPAPAPAPPPPCKDSLLEDDCATPCVWCTNVFKPWSGKCMSEKKASFMPPAIYKCAASTA